MSPRKRRGAGIMLVLAFVESFLDHVVDPGADPLPEQGTRMLDRFGHVWSVEDHGIRRVDNHRTEHNRPWHRWNSAQARAVGPLLNPSAITPRRGL